MKIALITTDNRGQFREYDKEAPWFGMAPEALLSGFTSLPELEVHIISCIRRPVKAPEKLADNIWFHSLHVPRIGWMRTLHQGCIRAVRKKLKEIQPDIVHGQGTEAEQAMCAALSGYPNVVTLLGIMREIAKIMHARPGSYGWMASLLESFALRRTAGVLCNSHFTEEKVRHRTPKTWLVPNAIRLPFFLKPLPAATPARCVLLNVGTIFPLKRQNELLDVAEQLHAEGLAFELHFLGEAPNEPYAARFLGRIGNSSYLFYHGFKSMDEVIAQYDGSTALVHVSAVESFGLAVAEALSRNLKFFGFKSGGVLDIATGVEGAELFEDCDWPGLKSAIAGWIRSGCPRPKTAARVMRERFHPDEIARQHLEIYREVLSTTRYENRKS